MALQLLYTIKKCYERKQLEETFLEIRSRKSDFFFFSRISERGNDNREQTIWDFMCQQSKLSQDIFFSRVHRLENERNETYPVIVWFKKFKEKEPVKTWGKAL